MFHIIMVQWPPDVGTWEALVQELEGLQTPPAPSQRLSVSTARLFEHAKTLRQRCFARLIKFYDGRLIVFKAPPGNELAFEIAPKNLCLRSAMAACRKAPVCRKALGNLPFIGRQIGDPELRKALQDLADIVAWEASEAFTADYYPGVEDVEPLGRDHVRDIMQGMQREMDREGNRVQHAPVVFEELPPQRQVALAERRRWWFAKFGITPARWKTGTFSLWDVDNKITFPPEGYYNRWDTSSIRWRTAVPFI